MRIKLALFLLCTFVATGCCVKQPADVTSAEVAPIAEGGFIQPGGVGIIPEDLIKSIGDSQYILIGESHNSFCDHLSQARIVEMLSQGGIKPVIGLEMVGKDKQKVLDKFNTGELAVEDLPKALGWNNKNSLDFELYRPIFEIARAENIPVYGLNLPREVVTEVRKKGLDALNKPNYKQWMPKHLILPMDVQRLELEKTYLAHEEIFNSGKKPVNQTEKQKRLAIDRFILSQAMWDSTMAENAVRLHKETGRPVIIMAGGGHVEYSWGIAYRLSAYDMSKITKIMPWRLEPTSALLAPKANDPSIPPEDMADYYYYCPSRVKSQLGMTLAATRDAEHIKIEEIEADSIADKAGLKSGDLILKAGDRLVTSPYDMHLEGVVAANNNDKVLSLLIEREGSKQTVKLKLK